MIPGERTLEAQRTGQPPLLDPSEANELTAADAAVDCAAPAREPLAPSSADTGRSAPKVDDPAEAEIYTEVRAKANVSVHSEALAEANSVTQAEALAEANVDAQAEALAEDTPESAAAEAQAADARRLKELMIRSSRARRRRTVTSTRTVDPPLPDWYAPDAGVAPETPRRDAATERTPTPRRA